MPNLVFRFPGGQLHATPWGHHVNEGLVEWPPSPWRIVRALLATGFSKLGWREPPPAARTLVAALAETLPSYRLPAATAAHTRHWMPVDNPNPDKRVRVLDAFARVSRNAELAVVWPAALSTDAESLLRELVDRLSYLGRAESVVSARLVADDELPEGALVSAGGTNRPGIEPIALLAPMTQAEYAQWRSEAAASSTGTKQRKVKESPFPEDALAALQVGTDFLHKHGWTQPPGSQRVMYFRPADSLATVAPRVVSGRRETQGADTALLALASQTQGAEVLPRLERGLPQVELLHQALLSQLGEASCPELRGRDANGKPLAGHRHAQLVALDVDGDGHVDHLLVHAAMGLGLAAQRALRSLRRTFTKGADPLFVTLVGLGTLAEFRRVGAIEIPELGSGRHWVSRTPFVPPRHLKTTRHTLEDQVQAELASRGLPAATRISVLNRDELVQRGFHRFVRVRPSKLPAAPRFFGLRVELEREAQGPIALGYASHFGLGLFAPAPPE